MPNSSQRYDTEIRSRLEGLYPSPNTKILDVGPGRGKFRDMLRSYKCMDAIEVWSSYIEKFRLNERYRYVYNEDVNAFTSFSNYQLVIMGDVLEHLEVEDAQNTLIRIDKSGCDVLVCIPFKMEQDEIDGNPYEIHRQDDLTHKIFMDRYPGFKTFVRDANYGVYFRKADQHNKNKEPEKESFDVHKKTFAGVHLAIATPTYGGEVTTTYLGSIWNTLNSLNRLGIKSSLLLSDGASIEKARNQLVARFMQNEDYTHLLFVDADIGWKVRELLRLIAFNRDIVSVACRKKKTDLSWTVNFGSEDVLVEDGLLEAEGIGCGFMLIKRHVIEKMEKAYPHLKVSDPESWNEEDYGAQYALFQFELKDGHYWSEDLTFCRRWRAIGGKIWIDPEGDLIHVGKYEYRGSLSSVVMSKENVA